MPLLRRADEQTQSEWRTLPEGVMRFHLGKPEVRLQEKWGSYQVRIPLELPNDEQERILDEMPPLAPGQQQSFRCWYSPGLSLGYVQNDGQYKSTRLIDMLAACLGSTNI